MVRTKAEVKRGKGALKKIAVPVMDGGTKPGRSKTATGRPYRRRPGKKAVMEIKTAQNCRDKNASGTGNQGLFKAPIGRCAREIVNELSTEVTQISPKALATLQAAAEECLQKHFALAMGITASRRGQMVTAVDLRFAHNIIANPHMLNEHSGTERMMTRAADGRYANRKKTAGTPFADGAPKAEKKAGGGSEAPAKPSGSAGAKDAPKSAEEARKTKQGKKAELPKGVQAKKQGDASSDDEFVDAE